MKVMINCQRCGLREFAKNVVWGVRYKEGTSPIRIIFVGEAPGAEEDNQGLPFVGKSGQLLRRIIEECCRKYGFDGSEVYITNVVKCRPPNNRTPSQDEVQRCSVYLESELSKYGGKGVYIVCLGRVAKDWFRIGGNIVNARNGVRETKYGKVVVTWHPAARGLEVKDALGVRDLDRLVGDIDNVFRWVRDGREYRTAEYKLVRSYEDIERMLREVVGERFSLDFETVGVDPYERGFEVVCYGIGTVSGNNYIVDVREVGEEKARGILEAVLVTGRPVVFNAGFEKVVAEWWLGKELDVRFDDLQFLYFLVNGGRMKNFNLKVLAKDFTEYGLYGLSEEELRRIKEVDRDRLWRYCVTDARVTLDLFNVFEGLLQVDRLEWSEIFGEERRSVLDAYRELNDRMVLVVSELKRNGMKVDYEYLSRVKEEMEARIKGIKDEIVRIVGKINLDAPQQVLRELRRRGIEVESTSKEVLEEYYERDEFVRLLLDYREATKLYRTFILGLLEKGFESVDGLIRGKFSVVGSASGRLSCSDPNLMNIPTRMGPIIENAFVSRFGDEGVMVKADLSQHELRVAALYSGDRNMIEAYRQGRDLHTEVAMKVYGLREEEIGTEREKLLRRYAKGFNFGVIYGRGAKSIAKELGIGEEEAERMRREYFQYFSGLWRWLEEVKRFGKRYGYVRTMFGRVRYLVNVDEEMNVDSVAVNTPIQSAASDIAIKIVAQVIRRMREEGLESRVVNFIHDAILVDCYLPELERVRSIIEEAVRDVEVPVEKVIPFGIDIVYGRSWGECKD